MSSAFLTSSNLLYFSHSAHVEEAMSYARRSVDDQQIRAYEVGSRARSSVFKCTHAYSLSL